ncbi:uncharacterized protein LOC116005692 [Ipomoea triloba]|uniref:uncharacterized protein LOC116005692 n=1 Tax=Ipomoea triloba TaxID=35885 RepID=UPI00125D949D|nr:uncharacterized protein LOC116005692 [Ipomoea triloba]
MAKAYNKMEWSFLREIMLKMGFDHRWVNFVMRCVTTVRYKVNVNGCLTDFILPTYGLRQGDHLSQYLFILCAEGLSHLFARVVIIGMISPCVVARGAPGVSHLFFDDDNMLFFKATLSESKDVKGCLIEYEYMSGQSVNFGKSSIVFSRNTEEGIKNVVSTIFNVTQTYNIGKYLGLPMGVGRNNKEVFSYIGAKINHCLGGWNKNMLSKVGKEILLKSIAQALPTYAMSIYFLPISFYERLERIMNEYWWTGMRSDLASYLTGGCFIGKA